MCVSLDSFKTGIGQIREFRVLPLGAATVPGESEHWGKGCCVSSLGLPQQLDFSGVLDAEEG